MRKNYLFKSLLAAAVGTLVGSAALAADDTTTISGKMFADLSNYDASNDGVNSPANGFGIDVKRFYLVVDHR